MVKYFDNLPDNDHCPYEFLDAEPHLRDVVRYMRPSDWAVAMGITVGVPGVVWSMGKLWFVENVGADFEL